MKDLRDKSLDGLRGFAALYVLIFHYFTILKLPNESIQRLVDHGWTYVAPFFVVSGYLIARSLQYSHAGERHWLANFYIRRLARILPLWWALLVMDAWVRGMSPEVFLSQMFFYFGVLAYDPRYVVIDPAWSLYVEMVFYAVAPFLLLLVNSWWRALVAFFAFTALAFLWRSYAIANGVPSAHYFIERQPMCNFQFFMFGAFAWYLAQDKVAMQWLKRIGGKWTYWVLDALALLGIFAPAFALYIPLEIAATSLFLAALVPGTALHWIFVRQPCVWLGVHCYSIYISQGFLLFWTGNARWHMAQRLDIPGWPGDVVGFAIFFFILAIFVQMTAQFIEIPSQKYFAKFLRRERS